MSEKDISTKYDRLLSQLKEGYIDFRWLRGPKIHEYRQTARSLVTELHRRGHFSRMLEIGCGPGTWTRLLSRRCGKLIAVDISRGMITSASKTPMHNVKFVCADFLSDSVKFDESFDGIYGIRVFEYFCDKRAAVRKANEMLNAGGVLCFITKSPWYVPALLVKLLVTVRRACGTEWMPRLIQDLIPVYSDLNSGADSPTAVMSLFRSEGFDQVEVYPAVIGVFFSKLNSKVFDPLYWFFDHIFAALRKKRVPFIFWPLAESYLISGVKRQR